MEFVGCSVFVDCGTFGVYQGKVSSVDVPAMSITLTNVMKDGEFSPGSHVLNSAEIVDIKVLRMGTPRERGEVQPRQSKTVAIKNKLAENSSTEDKPEKSVKTPTVTVEKVKKNSESIQSPAKPSTPVKTEKETSKREMPQAQMAQISVKPSDNGNKIMQQLLLSPVSKPSVSAVPQKEKPATLMDNLFPKIDPNKQKENQKPKQNDMIPTAAIKILKRGEPFPQKPNSPMKENQEKKLGVEKPEAGDSKPKSDVNASKIEEKKMNQNSKQSEVIKGLPKELSKLDITKSSETAETKNAITVEVEKLGNSSTPVPGGFKIDPLHLISSLAAPSSVSPVKVVSSPKKMAPQRSLSVNDQPAPCKPQQYEKFGDFKKFTEKQAPAPLSLTPSGNRSKGNSSSPTGVPTNDFANGYGKVHRRNRALDGDIDQETLEKDFDFTGNLALMVKEEDEEGDDTDTFEPPADIRNYRNDENILSDSSRVTSHIRTAELTSKPQTENQESAKPDAVNSPSTTSSTFRLPQNISQGSKLGVAYFTAYRALFVKANAQPGQSVFIHDASSSVGLASVQLAKAHGLQVFGSAGSAERIERAKSAGADEIVNHNDNNYVDSVMKKHPNGFDIILEMHANVNLNHDLAMIAKFGHICIIGNRGRIEIDPRRIMQKECSIVGVFLGLTEPQEYEHMSNSVNSMFKNGTLKPLTDQESSIGDL